MFAALAALVLRLMLGNPDWDDRPTGGWSTRFGFGARRAAGRSVPQLHVNGIWLAHNASAGNRYPDEMLRALVAHGRFEVVLHTPADADPALPGWPGRTRMVVRRSRFTGWIFEQCYLPAATSGQTLLNFAGSAPVLKRRQLVTMPDAAPFRRPAGFSTSYLLLHLFSYRWLGRFAAGLVTESEYSAHELADVLRVDVDRFIVAGGAADALRGVHPVRPDLLVSGDHYLMIGTAAPHENVRAAATALADSGRRVVVLGMAGRCISHPSVVVADRVSDAALVWLYRHARACVLPSSYAGSGLSAVTAQALGCPVVCADSGALPEVCRDTALYFDAGDLDSLTAQLDRLEHETGLSADLRRRGFGNSERFSSADSACKVVGWAELIRRPAMRC